MRKFLFGLIIFFMIITSLLLLKQNPNTKVEDDQVRYIALGDSYTIGEGVRSDDSWPIQLVQKLHDNDVRITLVANPSVTGWTTQDLIDKELPIYESSDPDFATLLIGVNDWVRGVDEDTFHRNLKQIIDRMQKRLPDKQDIILITIPDFSVTPTGKRYDSEGNAAAGIARFNTIIKEEGKLRNLPVVDIYPIAQKMKNDPSPTSPDGLHPSGKEYALWTELIFPIALRMIEK